MNAQGSTSIFHLEGLHLSVAVVAYPSHIPRHAELSRSHMTTNPMNVIAKTNFKGTVKLFPTIR